MVAAQDLKSCDFGHAGSSPALGTKIKDPRMWFFSFCAWGVSKLLCSRRDENAGAMSRDACGRARPRGGGQAKFSEENLSRGSVPPLIKLLFLPPPL